jgi:3-phosphoshikimate 1-carboxyvinyltransferase
MTHPVRPLIAERSPWLRGRLAVPGDRASSRLALILGAMARGETLIEGLREAPGVLAIADMLQQLGARVEKRSSRWHVIGLGIGGFLQPERDLNFGAAAASLHLAMGTVGIYDFPTRFVGDAWLSSQSLQHMQAPLAVLGIKVLEQQEDGLPITLQGPRISVPPAYEVPPEAPHLKGVMLLAGLSIPGVTEIIEPHETSDRLERMLRGFGAQVERSTDAAGRQLTCLDGLPMLRAQRVEVPGDPDLVALVAVAALVVPGSEVVVETVSVSQTRNTVLSALLEMGGSIELEARRAVGGDEVADLRIRHSDLQGVAVGLAGDATAAECMALAVAAAFATGASRLDGLHLLPAIEQRRLQLLVAGLVASGVSCRVAGSSLEIEGAGGVAGGAPLAANGDPWLALAFLILGLAARSPVAVDDAAGIEPSFPGLLGGLEMLGASLVDTGSGISSEVAG